MKKIVLCVLLIQSVAYSQTKVEKVALFTGTGASLIGATFLVTNPFEKRTSESLSYMLLGGGISLNISGVILHFKKKKQWAF